MKKLCEVIEYGLKVVDCDKEETVIKWQESPSAETELADIHDKGTLAWIKDREETILPKFVIYTGSKKWGPYHDKVEACVVN
eukprot:3866841-Ditylum_brightwellii.AAC.1